MKVASPVGETLRRDRPIRCLSRYIIAHKADYDRLLPGVMRGEAWERWLPYG